MCSNFCGLFFDERCHNSGIKRATRGIAYVIEGSGRFDGLGIRGTDTGWWADKSKMVVLIRSLIEKAKLKDALKAAGITKKEWRQFIEVNPDFDVLRRAKVDNPLSPDQDKEFAFTKMMSCGLCGSGISADEKFKKQKNGNVHRYVYYGCTKSRDKNCKCGYISEEELIEQFVKLMDEVNIDEIGIKEKIKAGVERIKRFNFSLLGINDKIQVADIDIRNYMKFVLREGHDLEKRELLGCLQNKILLSNKQITLS